MSIIATSTHSLELLNKYAYERYVQSMKYCKDIRYCLLQKNNSHSCTSVAENNKTFKVIKIEVQFPVVKC